ncbi:M48 family metallopeptidase [Actinomadura madurae]|uniref:M48 family metallopeptidase n=1 Tax=Actinomadura madurae TaxID=1993 RepID=UPI0035581211
MPEVPELYVRQDPTPNAMALGSDHPFIVLNTGLIDLLDEEELRFVVGHEVGHILSGHAVYQTMMQILLQLGSRLAWLPLGNVGIAAIIIGLREWFRKAELSSDRAGLLVGQDVDAAKRVNMKLAGRDQAGRDEQRGVLAAGARVRRGRRCAGRHPEVPEPARAVAPVRGDPVRRDRPVGARRRVRADPGRRLPAPRRRRRRVGQRRDQGRRQVLPGVVGAHRRPVRRQGPRHGRRGGGRGRRAVRPVHPARQRADRPELTRVNQGRRDTDAAALSRPVLSRPVLSRPAAERPAS